MSAVDYQAVQRALAKHAGIADMDPGFLPLFDACRAYTMTSVERMFDLYKSVEYICKAGVRGCILEAGAWRGGSMMLAAMTALRVEMSPARDIVLFDTFEGHPKPDHESDVDLWGHAAIKDWHEAWAKVDLAEVRTNMESTGYPPEHIRLVKGQVEETMSGSGLGRIAMARLDTDWYSGAKAALEFCWPRLSAGGVLIIDDYGHYKGQRQAVDEYFAHGPAVKLNRIDYGCRTVIKP